jgi:MFS family permease
MMILGSLMIIPVHLTLGLTSLHPVIPMIVLGISFSLVPAALWPAIPVIVEERRLGTAFGLMTLIQNIGLTVFPWFAGKITDISGGDYTNTMIMFASLGFFGLIFSLMLKVTDKRERAGLELPSEKTQMT